MQDKQPQQAGANAVGHKSVIGAVITGITDLFRKANRIPELDPNVRIDGKVCMVTGANSGLGKAVATQLAQRGAKKVIMACRSESTAARDEIIRDSGNPNVEVLQVDLSDLNSVAKFCDALKAQRIQLDIVVFNAGLMPLESRRSAQGYEIMFAVHFLANRYLVKRLLDDGLLNMAGDDIPRLVFVSSETHQSSAPIDFANFAAYHEYGIKGGMKIYGLSKLYLSTFVRELSRRLNADESQPQVAVHSLCPGPIASNIARESPGILKPIIKPIMKLFFLTPAKAAAPVIYLSCAPQMGKTTNVYMHIMRQKLASPLATDAENGRKLWEASEQLLAGVHPPEG